ncbi:hypothetical protein WG66_012537 [Moniliophthora roreri]|nr:hypothetical protein WG66_012537 [Moniliophthora roreri]
MALREKVVRIDQKSHPVISDATTRAVARVKAVEQHLQFLTLVSATCWPHREWLRTIDMAREGYR